MSDPPFDPTQPPHDPTRPPEPIHPSEQEGTRGLQAVGPWIEAQRRRRLWFLRLTIGGLGAGLVLIGVGLVIARTSGLAALRWELENVDVDPETGVRPGAEDRTFAVDGAREAVLFVHGWCSSPRDFGPLPEQVAAAGMHARLMRLPGHGTDPRDFAAATLEDWREAVKREYEALEGTFERVHLVGFSMGGALCVELAAEREAASLVVIAPFFGLPYPRPFGLRVGTLADWLDPLLPWVDGGREVNSLECREFAAEVIKYRAIPLSAAVQVDRLGAIVTDPRLLGRVTEPLLVIGSPNDPVASAERAFEALRQTASETRVEVVAENSGHILVWDCDRDQVRAAVLDFLID
ncbi:MAG: alpha/beta fold hydrolase [Planctomycetota bacterium]